MATKVVTGKVRFSYAHVFEPTSMNDAQEKKYQVNLIIPKKDKATIAKIEAAIKEALEAGKVEKFKGKIPVSWRSPLRDGDTEKPDDENYANSYFINAKSSNKPGIVDADKNEILSRDEFYSGCYGRASINFYAYDTAGNKGVGCGLNGVQKLEDGERLGGGGFDANDFGDDDDIL